MNCFFKKLKVFVPLRRCKMILGIGNHHHKKGDEKQVLFHFD
jgi:hypothetical protein